MTCLTGIALLLELITPIGAASAAETPPYLGTVWVGSGLMGPTDPTDFLGTTALGMGDRMTFDRRTQTWVTEPSYLFRADYTAGRPVEVIVDPELGDASAAQSTADRYARLVGQLPRACRANLDAIWIHPGNEDAGGGNRSVLIHTGYAEQHADFMEEVLVHECAHTSLDWGWQGPVDQAAWHAAAAADGVFISTYAADHPDREDVAETFLPYLVAKRGPSQGWTAAQIDALRTRFSHRFAYFDSLNLDLSPMTFASAPVPTATPSSTAASSSAAARPRPGAPCARSIVGARITTRAYGPLRCTAARGRTTWVRVRR